MKNINKIFCLFSSCRGQGFQMKKDQTIAGEQIRRADIQTTAYSSVGRAEDCRKDDILRSLDRVRVGGWHEKVFFETNLTNFLEGYFLKIQNNFHY